MANDESNVSLDLLRTQLDRANAENAAHLKDGGGGGTFNDMEARVKLLEYRADQTEKLLVRMDGKLDGLVKDVSEIKGKVGTLPTTWNIIGIFTALMGLLLGGAGIALTIIRFMPPPV